LPFLCICEPCLLNIATCAGHVPPENAQHDGMVSNRSHIFSCLSKAPQRCHPPSSIERAIQHSHNKWSLGHTPQTAHYIRSGQCGVVNNQMRLCRLKVLNQAKNTRRRALQHIVSSYLRGAHVVHLDSSTYFRHRAGYRRGRTELAPSKEHTRARVTPS
jgi:hypothetical protein